MEHGVTVVVPPEIGAVVAALVELDHNWTELGTHLFR